VARELMKKGFTNVYALEGGWQAWLDLQAPVQVRDVVVPAAPVSPGGR
jgi:rhodanese-related sulfurtransferase